MTHDSWLAKFINLSIVLLLTAGLYACDHKQSDDGNAETTSPLPSDVTESPNVSDGKPVLYQLTDRGQMMSYVIRTKQNKLIIIDGGYDRNETDLVQLAKNLTGSSVPEIDAWFMTHVHEDHVDAFSEIMAQQIPSLRVNRVYYNFPSRTFVAKYEDSALETYDNFYKALESLKEEQITIVQTGDTYVVDDVRINVLLTPDESLTENPINESSVVYRFTIEGQTLLFLGDAGERTGSRLLKMYKDNIASDIVQMAHHGSYGVAKTFYKRVNPKVCLWPTPKWLWENDNGEGYNTGPYDTISVYEYMVNQVGVRKHYVAKDGVHMLTFPLDLTNE